MNIYRLLHYFVLLNLDLDLQLLWGWRLFKNLLPRLQPRLSSATRTPEVKSNTSLSVCSRPRVPRAPRLSKGYSKQRDDSFFNIVASFSEITGVIKSIWHLLVCVCVFDLMQSSSNWCGEDDAGQHWAIGSSAVSLPVLITSAVNVCKSLDLSVNVNQTVLNPPR